MDLDDARRVALSFPGTSELPHFEKSSFRVGGKIFATVPEDGLHLHVLVTDEEAYSVVAEGDPGTELLTWGRRVAGVRLTLATAPTELVIELLEGAWRRRAPKRLVAAYDALEHPRHHE